MGYFQGTLRIVTPSYGKNLPNHPKPPSLAILRLLSDNAFVDRKQVASWCLFDFANSSYSAVIAAVVFPVYYANVIVGNETGQGDLWWGRAISLSMLLVAVSSPFLGGIADHAGMRKRMLAVYTIL